MNHHDVGMVDAPGGGGFILKSPQKLRVIEKPAIQDLESDGSVAYANLLGKIDRAHAPSSQSPYDAEAAGQPGRKLRHRFAHRHQQKCGVVRTIRNLVREGP